MDRLDKMLAQRVEATTEWVNANLEFDKTMEAEAKALSDKLRVLQSLWKQSGKSIPAILQALQIQNAGYNLKTDPKVTPHCR